jgi:hypothetical protein
MRHINSSAGVGKLFTLCGSVACCALSGLGLWSVSESYSQIESETIEPTVEATPTVTPTNTATPTATPAPGCRYHKVDFSHVGSTNEFMISIRGSKLSCLDRFIADAIKAAETALRGVDITDYAPGLDYRARGTGNAHGMGFVFASRLWAYLKGANDLATGLEADVKNSATVKSDNKTARKFIDCTGGYDGVTRKPQVYARYQIGGAFDVDEHSDGINLGNGCDSGVIYLGDQCSFVNVETAKASTQGLCSSTEMDLTVSTPLSLVWSYSGTKEPSTIVQFKLDPRSDSAQSMWRGSAALPLLVHDPRHTGVITSAEQLFGNWTFGGKRLPSSDDKNSSPAPWRDGYEPLATLDKDLDGEVSGAELDPLALWFDDNRDGISQRGEVRTLADVSVTTLYYNPDKTEQGAIIASKGYERVVDGKAIVLPSMDWYEKGLKAGPGDLLESESGSVSDSASSKQTSKQVSKTQNGETSRLFGVWGWAIDTSSNGSSEASRASGYLSLDPLENGVFGTTISQVDVSGDPKLAGMVGFKHFVGSLSKTEAGQQEVKFTVKVANGATLSNTATLSVDGKTLKGKTVVANSDNSTTGSYEYTWNAQRLTKY